MSIEASLPLILPKSNYIVWIFTGSLDALPYQQTPSLNKHFINYVIRTKYLTRPLVIWVYLIYKLSMIYLTHHYVHHFQETHR